MKDFIIVGRGLAAIVLAHALHQENISFYIIGSENLSNCSRVAAGIWNPIVFKRLLKSWLADDLVPCLNEFYNACEGYTNRKFLTQRLLYKPFTEDHEKILWRTKAEKELSSFLDPLAYDVGANDLKNFKIINQFGIVKQCGNLNVSDFLDSTNIFFKDVITDEVFEHSELKMHNEGVSYKGLRAKNIIFCEGYLVKNNPFFNWIPLKPAKGEVLTINAAELKLENKIFNRNGFLIDLENGQFKVGATYEWQDLTENTTDKGLTELINKLEQLISCNYDIVCHQAGVRPSSVDRRPIVGAHPVHQKMFVFNGLGTKGVMLAPFFAKKFVNFYLQKEELQKEVNVNRFYSLYVE